VKFNAHLLLKNIEDAGFSIMPKRHGQLKDHSIGPPKRSTANCNPMRCIQMFHAPQTGKKNGGSPNY
jgi:hypothetical protein